MNEFCVMSNDTDLILIALTDKDVSYHESIGFKVESIHKTYEEAMNSAKELESR